MKSRRWRTWIAVVIALCACASAGYLASAALGTKSSDPRLIVPDRSIGAVSIGMTRAQVESTYGEPFRTLDLAGAGGTDALLAYYRTHGGTLYVTYANGRVVSIETNSPYYRTRGGKGVGRSIETPGSGFAADPCGLGVWNGGATDPLFTVYTRDGSVISSVLITQSAYFSACAGEGTVPFEPPVEPPPPPPPAAGTHALVVDVEPHGFGYVQSDPPGINCPGQCGNFFAAGTAVTLSATPSTGAQFTHWSGDCTGSGACVVSMSGPRSVTAHFTGSPVAPPPPPPPTTTTTPTETGPGSGT